MKAHERPADFAAVATHPTRELAMRYRVSNKTVARWRRELGIKLPPGAPKGNTNGMVRKRPAPGMDGPEQVRACLSCKRPRCTGQCELVR